MSCERAVWIAAADDATDRATWSGTPAHLIEGGRAVGLPFEGYALHRPGQTARRLWNGARLLRTGGYGGFQYAPWFLDRLWRGQPIAGRTILSCYQLLPDRLLNDPAVARWFYIDGTLTQLWGSPDYTARSLPAAVVAAALAREGRGYRQAAGVVCHSRWAADSVVADYGVPAKRVHVVVPGANLDPAAYARWRAAATLVVPDGPLRLVFVGMDGLRKGLDRLLAALPLARAGGAGVALQVIGCGPEGIAGARAVPGVEWLGRLDKRADADRFIATVAGAEIGCLLSRAEFGGMVQREFAALGLAGLGPAVDGAPDHAGPGALLVAPDATPATIAGLIIELARRGDTHQRLRNAAWAARDVATWADAARRLYAIVGCQRDDMDSPPLP